MADPVLIQIDDVERPATAKEKAHIQEILSGAVEPTPVGPQPEAGE